jgi:hypothetical protein
MAAGVCLHAAAAVLALLLGLVLLPFALAQAVPWWATAGAVVILATSASVLARGMRRAD